MLKRLMPCIVAAIALALLATEADAGCYTKSGRTYCTTTKTGSIVLNETFTGCDPDPESNDCETQSFSALTSNSIAFCSNPSDPDGLPPIRTTCGEDVTFGGTPEECTFEPPAQKNKIPGGGLATGHKCTSSTEFEPQGGCETACPPGSTLLDVVPIAMTTQVDVLFGGIVPQASSSPTECPTDPCRIEESCTISPNRIGFEASRTYTCQTTFVGPTFESDCANEDDDDNDGSIDCNDSDCDGAENCAPPVTLEICDNEQDDDGDDAADCGDPDCFSFPACQPPEF